MRTSLVNYPAGQFAIIFIVINELHSIALQVDNGGIVRIDFGESSKTKLMREADKIILPPPD
jgi:hypothetical protein